MRNINVLSGMNSTCIKAMLFFCLWWFIFLKSLLILLPQNFPFHYVQKLRLFWTLLTRAQLENSNLTGPSATEKRKKYFSCCFLGIFWFKFNVCADPRVMWSWFSNSTLELCNNTNKLWLHHHLVGRKLFYLSKK